jgi:hypothetical protein
LALLFIKIKTKFSHEIAKMTSTSLEENVTYDDVSGLFFPSHPPDMQNYLLGLSHYYIRAKRIVSSSAYVPKKVVLPKIGQLTVK